AIAYITEDGIRALEKELLQKDSVKILCGVHGCISDLSALNNLVLQSNNRVAGRVFLGANVFHPKLYLFQNKDTATLLVGSSNLTGSGLQTNEEVFLESVGPLSSQPIIDTIAYFDNLWSANSVAVGKYLQEHPNYIVRQNQNDNLTSEQKQKLDSLKKEVIFRGPKPEEIEFTFKVNRSFLSSLYYHPITIPTSYNQLMKKYVQSTNRNATIITPNNKRINGRIHHSTSSWDHYYQIRSLRKEDKDITDKLNIDQNIKVKVELNEEIVTVYLSETMGSRG
ncbi:MAG: phospholipase D-like domain-containing protein, partial [candidate division Zixibacteria bacterium]|nr:phospholipase D-like domain-containing protein [candidate division Zixibacteria bacterium]